MAQRQRMRPKVLVMTSTYPRWVDDHEPGFVHELSKRLLGDFDVSVLSPHASGSAAFEDLEGVQVHRFRYAPSIFETLVNDGGIVTNLKKFRWIWFLLIIFRIGTLYSPLKLFVPMSFIMFCLGIGYYGFTFVTEGRFTNMSALLLTTSLMLFTVGLVSEQITTWMYKEDD